MLKLVMKQRNKIKRIVTEKFLLEPERPTEQLLKRLGITINRFNQIINNTGSKEMDAIEIQRFAAWLQVPIEEIFDHSIAEL